jgi:hypothetical protein
LLLKALEGMPLLRKLLPTLKVELLLLLLVLLLLADAASGVLLLLIHLVAAS